MFYRFNKKAQIGETMTWVFATIIIIIILVLSIFIVSFTENNRDMQVLRVSDLLAMKSFTGYLSTKEPSGKIILEELKDKKDFSQYDGELAKKIFETLYSKDYPKNIWLGFFTEGEGVNQKGYFGTEPTGFESGGVFANIYYASVEESIFLTPNKKIILDLITEKRE